jgi:hypothetical protein
MAPAARAGQDENESPTIRVPAQGSGGAAIRDEIRSIPSLGGWLPTTLLILEPRIGQFHVATPCRLWSNTPSLGSCSCREPLYCSRPNLPLLSPYPFVLDSDWTAQRSATAADIAEAGVSPPLSPETRTR